MKQITAKYKSRCMYQHTLDCDGIQPGDRMMYDGPRRSWHPKCGPTGVDRRADQDYMDGLRQAKEGSWIRRYMGEDAAIDYEIRMDDESVGFPGG